jgi:NTE family protein
VVVALHSIAPAPPQLADEHRPDAFEGASQIFQAVLVDPVVHDMATPAAVNTLVPASGTEDKQSIPHILVAPERGDRRARPGRCSRALRSVPQLASACAARAPRPRRLRGTDPLHGELLSYLLFAPEFAKALIELGREDARQWLSQPHEDGSWELGPLGGQAGRLLGRG